MVKIQHTWHTHYHASRRGGGEIGVHLPPPPPHIENQTIFYYMGGILVKYFSPRGGLFGTFFHLWGALFTM